MNYFPSAASYTPPPSFSSFYSNNGCAPPNSNGSPYYAFYPYSPHGYQYSFPVNNISTSSPHSYVPPSLQDPPSSPLSNVNKTKVKVINLNVGGHKFTTQLRTLLSHPGSLLHEIFSELSNIPKDPNGLYFIDRDGTSFKHVLNFLRDGTCPPRTLSTAELELIQREAAYYRLPIFEEQRPRGYPSDIDLDSSAKARVSTLPPPSPAKTEIPQYFDELKTGKSLRVLAEMAMGDEMKKMTDQSAPKRLLQPTVHDDCNALLLSSNNSFPFEFDESLKKRKLKIKIREKKIGSAKGIATYQSNVQGVTWNKTKECWEVTNYDGQGKKKRKTFSKKKYQTIEAAKLKAEECRMIQLAQKLELLDVEINMRDSAKRKKHKIAVGSAENYTPFHPGYRN
mmetsp:Transcript_16070/g.21238  ORF Transcript_16070/g.21238 Transcript_16070/m.21238 type:complete len:395 (+) Transcript_16070:75-1259(+)